MKITTLDEALERIKELEKEVAELKAENEKLRKRNFGGRKKHDEAWMAAEEQPIAIWHITGNCRN